ncbi:MAG TPA: hypothetical protein VKB93_29900 [Thermoanaerobaculia bacterium]|nr:hypothetical protein [Thermoanaerobaculia bacterium]
MKRLLWGVLVVVVAAFGGNAFAQSCPTAPPTLVYPPNNSANIPRENITNSVPLKWTGVANTTSYDIYFGPQGSGCANLHGTETGGTGNKQWTPPAGEIVDGASYEWKVVAKGAIGCPLKPSTCNTFTMTACPTSAPTLNAPANGSTIPPGATTLSWNPVANAGFYEVFISIDGAPPTIVTTTSTIRAITTEPGHNYSWAVRSAKSLCANGFTSQIFNFNTSCPTTPPAPATPVENAAFNDQSAITFSWGSVDGASSYGLYRSQDGGQTWTLFASNLTSRTYSATFPIGSWKWRVRANFSGNCAPVDSAMRGFTVISASCSNTPPTLTGPADGAAQTQPVLLTWSSPAAQGKTFLIFVSGPNGTSQAGSTTNNSFVLTGLTPGTYQWYVVEKNPNCPDVTSDKRTLIINKRECVNETITILSPANATTTSSPVTISWTAVQNATQYRIWASQNGGALALIARTTATSATVTLPAGTFLFKIEAQREDCPSILSNERGFTVPAAADCGNNTAPQLGTPTPKQDPSTGRKSMVLPWIAQSRGTAILYRVFVALGSQPFENVGDTRDATQVEASLPAGEYRWFVQVLFANCPAMNSEIGTFTVEESAPRCSSDAPVVTEPVNGATVQKLRFRVTEVARSSRQVRYRFFAIVDRTNAQAEPVFLGASTTPEFEPALQLPPGTYSVFVERAVDECPSTFSDRITVTIARAQNCNTTAAQLTSPANGATNVSPEVDFRWNAVPQQGAAYVLLVQVNDGAFTAVGTTTDTHLTRRVPPGRIRWVVVALNEGCDPKISQAFAFEVALSRNCELPPPVGVTPSGIEEASDLGVGFAWNFVRGASNYHLFVWKDGEEPAEVAVTATRKARVPLSPGAYHWYVAAEVPNCGMLQSATGEFTVVEASACGAPGKPKAHVVGRALAGTPYTVRWSSLAHVKTYELQWSTTSDFANPQTYLLNDTEYTTAGSGGQELYYRIAGLSDCDDKRGPYSDVVKIVISPETATSASVDIGADGEVQQKLFIPGSSTPATFAVTFDKPWITAKPSSGPLPPEGVTVTLTSDRGQLHLGGNTATVKIAVDSQSSSGGKLQPHASIVTTVPVNVNLVTPVTPAGKSGPSPDSLIFAAVGHAPGQNGSFFESDVRVANLGAQPMKYQVNYTPSNTDGTVTGQTTTIEIAPNQTLALDDILSSLFGLGDTTGAIGMLEVRPLTTSTSSSSSLFSTVSSTAQQLLTLGSSRTYNFTPAGTFGQYIPATPYAKFLGGGKILSLMQVAQSAALRANFGFVEASGQPVNLDLRVFDIANHLLATIPVSLTASEHKQIGLLLASNGITDLEDGRVEVQVTSGNGKVTAYVSEVDNATNDPFLVSAVEKNSVNTNRYIVPGMAHKDLGFAFWVSDLRVFNGGTTQVPATLTFYTEANPSSFVQKQITLDPGEIEVLNDVVQNLFGQPNGAGGSIVVTTPTNVPLGVTARTYNKTTNGSYGQFIPGVTVADAVGTGQRALQVLQVENSTRFRTYIGMTETTGNPARVEVALTLPDSIVTPVVTYDLAGNEYRQISLSDFGIEDAIYNGRVSVKVISGTGKVTAYGSAVDMSTNDGTYIQAQ